MDTQSTEHTSTAAEQPPTATSKQAAGWQAKVVWVSLLVGLSIGATVYVLLHLAGKLGSMGQEGSNAAQIWSLIVAILELGASVTAIIIAVWPHKTKRSKKSSYRKSFATHRPQYIAAAIAAACLAFIVPPLINKWTFRHVSKQDVTHQITLKHNTGLVDGDVAHIDIPGSKHHQLQFTLQVINRSSTGSCEAPARMDITPSYGMLQLTPMADVASGKPQTITVTHIDQPLRLTVALHNDPYCTVDLAVTSAVYAQ
jgi:hypothetical protein